MEMSLTEETFQAMRNRYPLLTRSHAEFIIRRSFVSNEININNEDAKFWKVESLIVHVPDSIVYYFWCYHDINIDHQIKIYPNADGVFYYLTEVSNHGE